VPAPYATQLSTITNQEAQEPELMQVAKDTEGINIFFPDQIQSNDPGFVLYGASRGIPGPYNFPGLPHGGITLSYLTIPDDQIGEVMAHEVGHYLGLFHTTERPGTLFDSLSDTPECPPSRDVSGEKWVTAPECIGYGADNLMFWEASEQAQRTVSAQQRFVLHQNPMIH
jgi:hypothetical protein